MARRILSLPGKDVPVGNLAVRQVDASGNILGWADESPDQRWSDLNAMLGEVYGASRPISVTTYTLQVTDFGARLSFTASSAVTVTAPPGLGAGFEVTIEQLGTGQISLSAGAGVTINNFSGQTKTAGQYAVASLLGNVADTYNWVGQTG